MPSLRDARLLQPNTQLATPTQIQRLQQQSSRRHYLLFAIQLLNLDAVLCVPHINSSAVTLACASLVLRIASSSIVARDHRHHESTGVDQERQTAAEARSGAKCSSQCPRDVEEGCCPNRGAASCKCLISTECSHIAAESSSHGNPSQYL